MPIDQAGSRSFRVVPEVNGAAASIDSAAISSEAIPPRPAERTDRVDPVQASSIANRGWRHRFRQTTCRPELDHRSQLRRAVTFASCAIGHRHSASRRRDIETQWPGKPATRRQRRATFCAIAVMARSRMAKRRSLNDAFQYGSLTAAIDRAPITGSSLHSAAPTLPLPTGGLALDLIENGG